jgi:mannose-6-phosphate isomerase-like protein (cupin superfamily)
MAIPVVKPARAEVLRGVARYGELARVETGLPDMTLADCHRTFLNVLGFRQPQQAQEYSPFGDAVQAKIGHMKAGFGVAFVECLPGRGTLMHNHDTNESFMVVDGQWHFDWEGAAGVERVTLGPRDFMSFPVGVQRRFECAEAPIGKAAGTLLAIIVGDAPAAEYSPAATQRLAQAGLIPG